MNTLDSSTHERILNRLLRLQLGNFGDTKLIREGVFELRCFFGPGYRIYFGKEHNELIILLHGGDKKSQQKDIQRAIAYLQEYRNEKKSSSLF